MDIFEHSHWAKSFEGRPIPLYSSTKNCLQGDHDPLLLIGGVHGDEPEGVELAKKTLEFLKNASFKKHWILIPCINPDGFTKNQRVNGQGIDLNRNFPSKNWSATFEKERYYPGKKPCESPEVQSLVSLIYASRPKVIIHFHSWNPCIVCSGPLNHPYAQALSRSSGYELVNDIGYPTPGSLGDFGWQELKVPVICVEEQEKSDLSQVWPHFEAGMREIFLNPS